MPHFRVIVGASRDDISPKVQISHVAVPGNIQFAIVDGVAAWSKQGQELDCKTSA